MVIHRLCISLAANRYRIVNCIGKRKNCFRRVNKREYNRAVIDAPLNTRLNCVFLPGHFHVVPTGETAMTDLLTLLNRLRRPKLLIQAARFGMIDYRRETALRRLLGCAGLPGNGAALAALMEIEDALDEQRRGDDAGYSARRHVDVMIAIMGEARLMRAARHPAPACRT